MRLPDTLGAALLTKLKMPAPRRGYIARRGLFEKLARWESFGVIYIRGAAGMGKTTLVSSFLKEHTALHAAWLSLDAEDDDLFVFWHDFAAAMATLPGMDAKRLTGLFDAGELSGAQADVIARRALEAADGMEPGLLVLDDLHLLRDEGLLHTLETFIAALPEQLHLCLLSREAPAVYLGGLAVEGRLLFIDGEALAISAEEGVRFLRDTLGMEEADERAARLAAQAEGWIGGLQLLAAADGMGAASPRTGRALAGEYLTHEIFATLSGEEQRFLTVTAILPYFDAVLCATLLGPGAYHEIIGRLVGKNLFLICVDEECGVYRYHSILGDYLKQQFAALPQDEQTVLHRRAAAAFLSRGERQAALPHLLAAGAYAEAGQQLALLSARAETWHYLNRLPLEVVMEDPNLAIQSVYYNLLVHPDMERARQVFRAFREDRAGEIFARTLGQAGIYVGETVDFKNPPAPVSPEQIEQTGLGPLSQALAYVQGASLLLERDEYAECARFAARAYDIAGGRSPFVDFYLFSSRAQLAEETGELNESLRMYGQMADAVARSPTTSLLGVYHAIGRTGIYLKRLEKEPAAAALEEADRGLKAFPHFPFLMTYGYAYNRLEYDLIFGPVDAAMDGLENLLRWSTRDFQSVLVCDRLLLYPLVQRCLPAVWEERFFAEYQADGGHIPFSARLVGARLLWRRGQRGTALRQVEEALAFSRANHNRLALVGAGLLKAAMLLESGGEARTVRNLLREALHYAWENHILLPFYVERAALGDALHALPGAELASGERAFWQEVCALAPPAAPDGVETLSARECEVLRELAHGLTNAQIADRLCITPATVKTHLWKAGRVHAGAGRRGSAQAGSAAVNRRKHIRPRAAMPHGAVCAYRVTGT